MIERSKPAPPGRMPVAGAKPVCPYCGHPAPLVWVHGHGQCARCGAVVEACCEGAPLNDQPPPAADDGDEGPDTTSRR